MTLKEKIFEAIFYNGYNFKPENVIPECEILADEFAIEFAEWCKQEYDVENTAFHNKWLDVDGKYVSTKELLEIYKKEKGL